MDSNDGEKEMADKIKALEKEKDLLKKKLNVMNECLSIEKLTEKICDIEMKLKTITILENMIKKLKNDVEPLNYLKSILTEKKLEKNNADFCMLKEESHVLLNKTSKEKSIITDILNKMHEEPLIVSDEDKSSDNSVILLDQSDKESENFLSVMSMNDCEVKTTDSETNEGFEIVDEGKHDKLISCDQTNFKSKPTVSKNNENMISIDNCDLPLEEAGSAVSSIQNNSSPLNPARWNSVMKELNLTR